MHLIENTLELECELVIKAMYPKVDCVLRLMVAKTHNAYSNHLFKMASINIESSLEDSIFPSGHLSARMRASEKAPCLLYLICSSGLSIVLST